MHAVVMLANVVFFKLDLHVILASLWSVLCSAQLSSYSIRRYMHSYKITPEIIHVDLSGIFL